MQYAEKMEGSGVGLIELMSMKPAELVSKFGMRKSHVATFVDTSMACGIQMPPNLELPRGPSGRRRSYTSSRTVAPLIDPASSAATPSLDKPPSSIPQPSPAEPHRTTLSEGGFSFGNSSARDSHNSTSSHSNSGNWSFSAMSRELNSNASESTSARESGFEPPALLRPIDATKPNQPKGIFGASPSGKAVSGLLKAPSSGDVTKASSLEKISLKLLAPEHKNGIDAAAEREAKMKATKTPPSFKAFTLFSDKPTLFFCIRRVGYGRHSLSLICRFQTFLLLRLKP